MNLYDAKQKDGGSTAAISALVGEELGLALVEHYLNQVGFNAKRVDGVPKTGKQIGFRLDGWIANDKTIYQVEVKNWGANSLGGKSYDGNYQAGWKQFAAMFKDPGLQKVLVAMQKPTGYSHLKLRPLACMWPIMHPEDLKHPCFSVSTSLLPTPTFDVDFEELCVFSMSGYLRHLGNETLDLNMPKTAERLRQLQTLFAVNS